jgi:hypothetical protein
MGQSVNGKLGQDKAHPLEEFPNFPWHLIKPKECGVSRGGITAGMDFNPRKPHIDFIYEDICADAWAIPDELAAMLEQQREWGRQEHAMEMRSLLNEGIE